MLITSNAELIQAISSYVQTGVGVPPHQAALRHFVHTSCLCVACSPVPQTVYAVDKTGARSAVQFSAEALEQVRDAFSYQDRRSRR